MVDSQESPTFLPRDQRLAEIFNYMSPEELSRVYLIRPRKNHPGVPIYFKSSPEIYDRDDGVIVANPEIEDGYYALLNPNDHSRLTRGSKQDPVIKADDKRTLRFSAGIEDIPISVQQKKSTLGVGYEHERFSIFSNPSWLNYPSTLPGGIIRSRLKASPRGSR